MHMARLMQDYLRKTVPDIHQKRLSRLLQTASSLLSSTMMIE
jgi:hypothetical protein